MSPRLPVIHLAFSDFFTTLFHGQTPPRKPRRDDVDGWDPKPRRGGPMRRRG